jgi:hypothetical protein
MRANPDFDATAPLSHARVTVRLRDGRVLTRVAEGARGYPARPAPEAQLRSKFIDCATRALPEAAADSAWNVLGHIEDMDDVSTFGELLTPALQGSPS